MMGQRALDDSALARLDRIGGGSFIVEMIDLFLENAPIRLEAARAAHDAGDLATLHRAVHSLKSTAANLGARSLQRAAEAAEDRASAKDVDAMAPLLDDLYRRYEEARTELEAERERLKSRASQNPEEQQ
ncbi:MAG: Hpt domain-containing protein [Candidatus Longimicrobiales bacterium M2_2A_002]